MHDDIVLALDDQRRFVGRLDAPRRAERACAQTAAMARPIALDPDEDER